MKFPLIRSSHLEELARVATAEEQDGAYTSFASSCDQLLCLDQAEAAHDGDVRRESGPG